MALQTVTIGIHRGTWCPKKLCVNLSPFNKTIIVLKIIFKIYIVCLYLKSTPLMTCQAFGACCCCWGFCGLSVVCTVCPSVVAALPLLLTCITHTHKKTCSMKCYKMACAVLLRIYTHSEALPKKYCNNLPCQQKESIRIIFGFIFKRGCVKFDTQRTILQNKSQNVLVSRDNLVTPS